MRRNGLIKAYFKGDDDDKCSQINSRGKAGSLTCLTPSYSVLKRSDSRTAGHDIPNRLWDRELQYHFATAHKLAAIQRYMNLHYCVLLTSVSILSSNVTLHLRSGLFNYSFHTKIVWKKKMSDSSHTWYTHYSQPPSDHTNIIASTVSRIA